MHSTECMRSPSKLRMEKVGLKTHILRAEENTPPIGDQKKGFFHSIVHKISTHISGNIWKLHDYFFLPMNDPLSVTIVDDSNVINTELFGDSLEETSPLTSDKTYDYNIKMKTHLDNLEEMYDNTIKSQIANKLDRFSNGDMEIYSCGDDNIVGIHQNNKDTRMSANGNPAQGNIYPDGIYEDNSIVESFSLPCCDKKETPPTIDNSCTMEIHPQSMDKIAHTSCDEKDSIPTSANVDDEDSSVDIESFHIVQDSDVPPNVIDPIETITKPARSFRVFRKVDGIWHTTYETFVDTIEDPAARVRRYRMFRKLSEMWHEPTNELSVDPIEKITPPVPPVPSYRMYRECDEIWHEPTNELSQKTDVLESEIPTKRAYFSRQQQRKANVAATGRGPGRAKGQLRHSGVSQTRHRKKCTKPCFAADMENNSEIEQDVEMYHTVQNDYSSDNSLEDTDDYVLPDDLDFGNPVTTSSPVNVIPDILLNEDKPKTCDNNIKEPAVQLHEDYIDGTYDLQEHSSRPRVISECSVDSEDSFIVFDREDGNSRNDDNSNTNYETENEENQITTSKVRFNLIPTVHNMIQWNYAYRAARKGPWEEAARDRERFKGRINGIASVLNPILTEQHRANVWQKRFAQQD